MGGRIDCYFDIASFYSYIAFAQLLKTQQLLKQHSVEVEIHPVLLGAINAGSGNKPPWTLPAKAEYAGYDMQRACKAAGLPEMTPPGDLMEMGRTMLPLRALHHIKTTREQPTYLTAMHYLYHAFWTLHRPPTTPEVLRELLLEIPSAFTFPLDSAGRRLLFAADEVDGIVEAAATSQACRDALRQATDGALARGAFGAPWLWVTRAGGDGDGEEKGEPFFGSDRWGFVYEFLGLPYREVELLPPGKQAQAQAKL